MNIDWTALLIGAIPSVVSVIALLIQIARDRKKDLASVGKTRSEAAHELAQGEKTRIEATEKIVQMYEGIIERLEGRIKELEAEAKKKKLRPPFP